MKSHRIDVLSLIFGVLFVAAAAVGLSGEVDLTLREIEWVGAGLLVAVGIVLLAGARTRATTEEEEEGR